MMKYRYSDAEMYTLKLTERELTSLIGIKCSSK